MSLHMLKYLVLLGLVLLGAGCRLSQQRTAEAVTCPAPEDVAAQNVVVLWIELHESAMTPIRSRNSGVTAGDTGVLLNDEIHAARDVTKTSTTRSTSAAMPSLPPTPSAVHAVAWAG